MERLGRSFADTLAGLYSGVYDSELKAVAAKENHMQTLQAMEDATCPTLCAKVREIMRAASTTTRVVTGNDGAGNDGVPGFSIRELARIKSDPDAMDKAEQIQEERLRVWREAKVQRRKFVQLLTWQPGSQGLEATVAKAKSVAKFASKLNEAHRLFVFSADLFAEAPGESWKTEPKTSADALKPYMDFLGTRTGECDFVFIFDGRVRSVRRLIDGALERHRRSIEEMWIVVNESSAVIRSRRTCLGSRTKECCMAILPASRAHLTTKPRSDFSASGEDSTFHGTFTNVHCLTPDACP